MADNPIMLCFMNIAPYLSPSWLSHYRQNPNRYNWLVNISSIFYFAITWFNDPYIILYQISYQDRRTGLESKLLFTQDQLDQYYQTYLQILATVEATNRGCVIPSQ